MDGGGAAARQLRRLGTVLAVVLIAGVLGAPTARAAVEPQHGATYPVGTELTGPCLDMPAPSGEAPPHGDYREIDRLTNFFIERIDARGVRTMEFFGGITPTLLLTEPRCMTSLGDRFDVPIVASEPGRYLMEVWEQQTWWVGIDGIWEIVGNPDWAFGRIRLASRRFTVGSCEELRETCQREARRDYELQMRAVCTKPRKNLSVREASFFSLGCIISAEAVLRDKLKRCRCDRASASRTARGAGRPCATQAASPDGGAVASASPDGRATGPRPAQAAARDRALGRLLRRLDAAVARDGRRLANALTAPRRAHGQLPQAALAALARYQRDVGRLRSQLARLPRAGADGAARRLARRMATALHAGLGHFAAAGRAAQPADAARRLRAAQRDVRRAAAAARALDRRR